MRVKTRTSIERNAAKRKFLSPPKPAFRNEGVAKKTRKRQEKTRRMNSRSVNATVTPDPRKLRAVCGSFE